MAPTSGADDRTLCFNSPARAHQIRNQHLEFSGVNEERPASGRIAPLFSRAEFGEALVRSGLAFRVAMIQRLRRAIEQ